MAEEPETKERRKDEIALVSKLLTDSSGTICYIGSTSEDISGQYHRWHFYAKF